MWKWIVRVAKAPLVQEIAAAVLMVVVKHLSRPTTKRT